MPTIREIVGLYLQHSRAIGLHCARALSEQEKTLLMFCAVHGDFEVSACKAYMLSDWVEGQKSWKSIATKRKRASSVKACFNWALRGERIERNPFQHVSYAEAERRPDMPDDVFEQIARASTKPYEKVLRFMRATGCRLSELGEAKWGDVNLDKGIWTIPRHKSRRYTGKSKVIALIPQAIAVLRGMLQEDATALFASVDPNFIPNPLAPVFRNSQGREWSRISLGRNFNRLRARLKKRFGIDIKASLHGIRHRFGSCAVANGAPLKLVGQQMGHVSVTTTEKYYCDLSNEMPAIQAAARLGMPKEPGANP